MGDPADKRATYEDVRALPRHLAAELIRGTLVTHARSAARHALASSVLGGDLMGPFHRGSGGP